LDNPEPYLACPHCLTEIVTQENRPRAETKPAVTAETLKTPEGNVRGKKTAQHPTTAGCTHHFGYLSERSSKEKIPDECMACTDIVNCMLKAMRTQQGS
jgi:hypothetical protein